MGMRWQRMESHALQSAYGMKKQQKGILVRHVQPTYETAKHLKPDDIIMRFDGVQVASDGTVPFRCDRALCRILFDWKTCCNIYMLKLCLLHHSGTASTQGLTPFILV